MVSSDGWGWMVCFPQILLSVLGRGEIVNFDATNAYSVTWHMTVYNCMKLKSNRI